MDSGSETKLISAISNHDGNPGPTGDLPYTIHSWNPFKGAFTSVRVGCFDDRLLFLTGGEWGLGRGSLSADVSSDHGHFQ